MLSRVQAQQSAAELSACHNPKAKMNTNIKIYASIVDDLARKQLQTLLAQPAFADAKVRIMPDVHAGKGCVIGFTADLGNKVIPNIVGVDIGCGMLTVSLGRQKPDFAELDAIMHRNIPTGKYVHGRIVEDFPELDALHCLGELKHLDRLRCSLGSLGGGNHFVEVDAAANGEYYLVIHSGSRNLGKQVCEIYQQMAIDSVRGLTSPKEAKLRIIAEYKAAGRESEIQDAIRAYRKEYAERVPSVPADLCYLEGELRERYLDDMRICQHFATRNRELMAKVIVERLHLDVQDQFHTIHNYIDHESNIVRKGAISARAGEKLLIPVNMQDGCIYGVGKGNEDWNFSAPHGAGRLMSRMEARRKLSLEEFQQRMQGIYSTSVSMDTLDESPMAYKGIDSILGHLEPSVEVVDVFKPIYNFKAADDLDPWKRKRLHKSMSGT